MNKLDTLCFSDICKSFDNSKYLSEGRNTYILNKISLEFIQGKSYAITGASGAGKSTMLSLLSGLDVPTSGKVLFNDKDLSSFSKLEKENFLRYKLGLVFQVPYLIDELTVLENILIKDILLSKVTKNNTTNVLKILDIIGLSSKANFMPYLLSGGEQQRVAIARALYCKPSFLIADEPTSALDEKNKNIILDLFKLCKSEYGIGIILASHDKSVYSGMDFVYEISNALVNQMTIEDK